MRTAIIMLAVLIATPAFLATDAMAADTIYRWVDEKGEVHYGDLPPENTATEQVAIEPGGDKPPASDTASGEPDPFAEPAPSYAEQQRDERAKKRAELEENQRIIAEACAQRRTIVAQLEPSTRVMVQMQDGTVARMDDDVRLETLNEAKSYIARNCDG